MKANLIIVGLIAAAAACAQNADPVKADVPFDFVANGKTMHSGKVIVERSMVSAEAIINVLQATGFR